MDILSILENPAIRSLGRLPAAAFSWPSARMDIPADEWLYDEAAWRLCLDDGWRLHWFPSAEEAVATCPRAASPQDPPAAPAPEGEGRAIDLPASWECLGLGTPIYLNYGYPFQPDPPHLAPRPAPATTAREPNPSAVLRRSFRVPDEWAGRRVRIRFLAVQSALFLWCNGRFVGYSEDSALPAEFDLTPHLASGGDNALVALVCKYCSGSYLEDQDCWRLSGIPRDVFLYSVPETHIADAVVRPDLAARAFHLSATIASPRPGCTVEFTVDGTTVVSRPGSGEVASALVPLRSAGALPLWSPETPSLVPVRFVLRDRTGAVLDIRHFRSALVDSRVENGVYLLNGLPFTFLGVNRHEIHPDRGRAIAREDMLRDARLIKAGHFNAVRCSHYPNHPLWYEICDRLGIALCDEADVESHGLSYHRCVLPGDDPVWGDAVVERVGRMVRTDRNHPCILLWSLGNEAGYGDAFLRARETLRALDPRPVQYADMNAAADFDSQTYPTAQWLHDWLAGRAARKGEHGEAAAARQHGPQPSGKPFLANEYAHAMGNSSGDSAEIVALFRRTPRLAGGFVWEWCEHALRSIPDRARPGLYGGDFGDSPNDGAFCCDGLVRPDRTPNPGYWELRHAQQPLAVRFAGRQSKRHAILLENLRFALPIRDGLSWTLLRDGEPVRSGPIPLPFPIGAGGTAVFPLPFRPEPNDPAEYFWRIRLVENGETAAECELPHFPRSDFADTALPAPNPWWRAHRPPRTPWRPVDGTLLLDRATTDNDRGCRYVSTPENPARIGIRLALPRDALRAVSWYGRGPHECACDRKRSALVGLYRAAPGDLAHDYTHPQENGQRCDVRWLDLHLAVGTVRRISSPGLFSFTLRPYTHERLCAARHSSDLPRDGDWELVLDAAQRGVGGDNSWGLPVLPRYTLAGASPEPGFFEVLQKKRVTRPPPAW